MKFSVSSLSMTGYAAQEMINLDPCLGIEIFYEWGSKSSWEHLLSKAYQDRLGCFSIHSPFCLVDIGQADKQYLFSVLQEPFDLYHRYNAEFYVVHSQGAYVPQPADPVKRHDTQMLVKERLAEFADICCENGVHMVVENLFFAGGVPLFDQQEYLELFSEIPKIDSLIDIGHAMLGHYFVSDIQKQLRERLVGYHVHDNDGHSDLHLRIGSGIYNWEQFVKDVETYTPDATLVMEYNQGRPKDYLTDMIKVLHMGTTQEKVMR